MRIEIVDDIKKRLKEDNKYIRDVLVDKIPIDPKKAEHTILLTPELFSTIFTPQRIRLILRVKRNSIHNIYQIAKELGRKYEAVHRDIKYLEGYNIIKIREKEGKMIPYIDEKIEIPALGSA